MFDLLHEVELYRELIKKLNKLGFQFEDTSKERGHSDLIDAVNRIIVEVKLKKDTAEDGAAQLLYEIAKEKLENFLYLGLADSEWFHVFKSPKYGHILTFAKELDETLKSAPSKFSGKYVAEAGVVLGEPIWQGLWRNTKDDISKILNGSDVKIPFIADNLFGLHRILGLYKIKTTDLIAAFTDFDVSNVEVTKNRIVITRNKGDPVSLKYKGKMKLTHKWILERLRIPDVGALEELRQTSDRLQSDDKRINRGAFYTENLLSIEMGNKVLEHLKPDFIIEPYAGAGSLLISFVNKGYVKGWVNDYDEDASDMLAPDYGDIGYNVTCVDLINFSIDKAVKIIGNVKRPLFITNPPFSSTSGAAKKIEYGDLGDKYGRGNQIYPTIGKVIEIIKQLGKGYLAFFSPLGIFCERKAHMKLLNKILGNFTFVDGYIWSGKHFNDVSKKKPIAFTIWKYGGKTDLEKIQFETEEGKSIGFKRCLLLKQGWRYATRNNNDEILVGRNDRYNCPVSKLLTYNGTLEGSELLLKNVEFDFEFDKIPSELVYGLWSTLVGLRSIVGHPLWFDNAYTHMPDFSKKENFEILAYSLLYAFVGGIDYTEGKIGFVGARKIMKFGNSERLNDGTKYLFKKYGKLMVGSQTITDVLKDIKKNISKDNWRADIKKEISDRLDKIGYWDYIPLPKKKKTNPLIP